MMSKRKTICENLTVQGITNTATETATKFQKNTQRHMQAVSVLQQDQIHFTRSFRSEWNLRLFI